jgi:hypothetical protein
MRPCLHLVLALLASGVGCSGTLRQAYPGPERPAAEVAVLRETTQATVWAIDGARAGGFGSGLAILPGYRDVVLRVRLHTATFNVGWTIWTYCRVGLQAKPGTEYLSRVRMRTKRVPGLADRVDLEIGIEEVGGEKVALAHRCSRQPPTLAAPTEPG